ncbi:MAG: hypothetical protein J6T33_01690 [Bacteroidales bacterium]|nr:hypothetical protein [Bacteroidales bacterium]
MKNTYIIRKKDGISFRYVSEHKELKDAITEAKNLGKGYVVTVPTGDSFDDEKVLFKY